jgi:mannitol-1-/sugar-/sorbitol-6-/2-deoxyglucose-6-phosphatase
VAPLYVKGDVEKTFDQMWKHGVMPLRSTLFDMDGLLIDSEILWHRAEIEIFRSIGVPIPDEGPRETKGIYVDEVVRHWYEQFPWEGPSQRDVRDMLLDRVGELVTQEGVLLSGVHHALELTEQRGPVALASSTPLVLIERILRHFDLREAFTTVTSAEFEQWGKPNPAVFLTAAASINTYPTDCLVFEDSPAGVLAGKAARMTVVAVPVSDDVDHPVMGIADLVLPSLDELDAHWLDQRFATR